MKSVRAKDLILEMMMMLLLLLLLLLLMMMMMIIIIIIIIMTILRFSGCFLKGTRHARLEVLRVVILKVRASWDCNIWVLLTQETTHYTIPTDLSLRIQSRYPYCIYDQVVCMLHCLSHRSSVFPKLCYIINQNVALSPKSISTTLLTNVHNTQNTPHTLHNWRHNTHATGP
jgi:hypothetical protein